MSIKEYICDCNKIIINCKTYVRAIVAQSADESEAMRIIIHIRRSGGKDVRRLNLVHIFKTMNSMGGDISV